jgi:hypothetical protein
MHTSGKQHDRKRKYECNNNSNNKLQRNQNQFAILDDIDKNTEQNLILSIEQHQTKSRNLTTSSGGDKDLFFQVFGKNVCILFKQNHHLFNTAEFVVFVLGKASTFIEGSPKPSSKSEGKKMNTVNFRKSNIFQ